MIRERLNPGQRRTVEIIQTLGFGVVERLSIRNGSPCYEPEPRITQTIKLGSDSEQASDSDNDGLTLKREFEDLFSQLRRIQDGVVDIEIRHAVPFRLVLERRCTEFMTGEKKS